MDPLEIATSRVDSLSTEAKTKQRHAKHHVDGEKAPDPGESRCALRKFLEPKSMMKDDRLLGSL